MARTRRRVSHAVERASNGAGAIHALLLLLSFLLGAVLDWIRHQPYSFTWGWRLETFIILVAAWLSVSLMARWPHHEKSVARTAGVLLLMLFLGSLVIHEVLDHP
jgi:hypothetical protein